MIIKLIIESKNKRISRDSAIIKIILINFNNNKAILTSRNFKSIFLE